MNEDSTAREIAVPNPIAVSLDPAVLAQQITAEHKAVQRNNFAQPEPSGEQQMIVDSTNSSASVAKANLRRLYLTDANRIGGVIIAIRWIAVLIGLGFTATRVSEGNLGLVATVAITVFITCYRSISPINLGSRLTRTEAGIETSPTISLFFGVADVVILSAAIGIVDGFSNPFVGSVFAAIAVVAFGFGFLRGLLAITLGVAATTFVLYLSEPLIATDYLQQIGIVSGFFLAISIMPAVAFKRILEVEGQGAQVAEQRDRLAETNNLLEVLNDLARTLPSSLDLADAVDATKDQLVETFAADRLAVLIFEENTWSPIVQEGFQIPPKVHQNGLPAVISDAVLHVGVTINNDLGVYSKRFGSGMYTRLIANNTEIGFIAIEHNTPNFFTEADGELLNGMSDVLALTLANARSFNKLRTLAADEERTRIARDLHDRLGQYLTYISLEIERIKDDPKKRNEALTNLHTEVQRAISEFRETLLELRVAVSKDRPLRIVLQEVVERFEKRSKIKVRLAVEANERRLPAPIENELLRITQEALTNIEKHADASEVHIRWSISDQTGVLLVSDNGRGFDPGKGIRGSAYGLVGMRERAAAIGASIEITSEPGHGTNIVVQSRLTSG